MSSKKRKRKRTSQLENAVLSIRYAEKLEEVGKHRVTEFIPFDPLQENLAIDNGTQEKLMSVVAIMDGIGKLPGDFPKEKFDQPITYHKLPTQAVEWLKSAGFQAEAFTPLATYGYRHIFANKDRYIVSTENIEKFFSHLIHCLLVETQLIITRQYYYGLGFYVNKVPVIDLSMLPDEIKEIFSRPQLNKIAVDQLHGRIFLDYFVVMIRAQWDKFVSLSCLVFGIKQNWDSISDGMKALRQFIKETNNLHPACKHYLEVFLDIADERLKTDGWLKKYRDSLLHEVGQHSLGVAPHKKSLLTTSELWDKACKEHNWLREGIMALFIAFASKNTSQDSRAQTQFNAGNQ